MVDIGEAIKRLRTQLELSQRKAAEEVGISHVHLSNLESGKASPTTSLLDKFFDAWGIDLYMYAVVISGDKSRLPAALASSFDGLLAVWKKDIDLAIQRRGIQGN